MQWIKINYDHIEKLFFNKIEKFEEYYYFSWYNNDDLKEKYIVISVLINFIKENYIDSKYNLKWDNKLFTYILNLFNEMYKNWNKKIKDLVCVWFIEWLLPEDKKYFNRFINLLKYKDLQFCWTELIKYWYWS